VPGIEPLVTILTDSDRMPYITLTGRWCDVLNVHAPNEDKSDVMKDSF